MLFSWCPELNTKVGIDIFTFDFLFTVIDQTAHVECLFQIMMLHNTFSNVKKKCISSIGDTNPRKLFNSCEHHCAQSLYPRHIHNTTLNHYVEDCNLMDRRGWCKRVSYLGSTVDEDHWTT